MLDVNPGKDDDVTKPPRRRNEKSKRAILDAAFAVSSEVGYGNVSIEAIATRAGVGKQTIYRWWPSKGAVILDAFIDHMTPQLEWSNEPVLEDQLIAQITRTHAVLNDPVLGAHLAGLIGEAQRDPIVAERFRDTVVVPARNRTLRRLQRGADDGHLANDVDLELLADSLFAPMWFRLLIGAAPIDTFDPRAHVKQLLRSVNAS